MNLTYRQFELLVAAADSGSFSEAAQRLGISQPSLSESIGRIEHEVGSRLFERTTRSLKLTAEGRYAAAVARDIVRDFKRGLDRLARTGSRQGRVTVAALPSITCTVLAAALQELSRDHAAIEVGLHDVQHERALLLVTQGIADLAVTIRPARHDDLVFEEVASDVAYLVCRSDDPLTRRKHVRWRDLSGLPFIGITGNSSVRRLTDAAFIQAEVEAGLGVTALPSLTFSMFKGRSLAVRPLLAPRLRRNIGFVTFAGRTLPAHAEALMQAIRGRLRRAVLPKTLET